MILVYCTCPSLEVANRIAVRLVEERLAACVNCLPQVISTYRWQGKVQVEQECLLLVKTAKERFAAVKNRIVELHSYELPEVIAVDVVASLDRYAAWVETETRIA